jgi:MFS family permease
MMSPSLFSLLNAFAWSVSGLLVTRFLTSVGLPAMTVAAIPYISEMFPASKRGAQLDEFGGKPLTSRSFMNRFTKSAQLRTGAM